MPSVNAQLNNFVVDEPFISCAADAIYAKWRTNQTFTGHVNVRYAPNRFCYQVLVTNSQIELLVPHLDCRISRIRSVDPPGLVLETNVLISFHSEFVTAGDRLYTLKCLHTRATASNGDQPSVLKLATGVPQNASDDVTYELESEGSADVSRSRDGSHQQLECAYTVRASARGPPVDTVFIGSTVYHEWSCRNVRPDQCLIVTNCFLKTYDSQHHLVDEYGCSRDVNLLPELDYLDRSLVGQQTQVFGVAEKPYVQFQCQMNLVDIKPGLKCPRPKCSKPAVKAKPKRRKRDLQLSPGTDVQVFDALSQRVEVLQFGERPRASCRETTLVERYSPDDETICVSKLSFGLVVTSTLLAAICTLIIVLVSMYRRFSYTDIATG